MRYLEVGPANERRGKSDLLLVFRKRNKQEAISSL